MRSHSRAAGDTALEPLPKTVMSKLCLPEQKKSALFGTLSFQWQKYDYSPLIAEIIRRRHPELLLCAGHSVIDKEVLLTIAEASLTASSVILVETTPSSATEKAKNYRISDGGVVAMGQQFFSKRDDRTEAAVGNLEKAVTQRQFKFDKRSALHNQRALLLVCGELGVVSRRINPKYHELVQHHAPKLMEALKNATIILNPTHTRMGNGGTLKAKRKFLSSNQRIYLSSSNWDKVAGQRISRTLHSLWYDGVEGTPCNGCFENEYFCYREWNLTG